MIANATIGDGMIAFAVFGTFAFAHVNTETNYFLRSVL